MAHLMSSAQIDRDFSAANLVLPSNMCIMDAKYVQAQLCTLVNFLHLVHPEDMSPKSISGKEVSEALPLMVSACQTCISKGSMTTPTTRDMTVRETYTRSTVLSN